MIVLASELGIIHFRYLSCLAGNYYDAMTTSATGVTATKTSVYYSDKGTRVIRALNKLTGLITTLVGNAGNAGMTGNGKTLPKHHIFLSLSHGTLGIYTEYG